MAVQQQIERIIGPHNADARQPERLAGRASKRKLKGSLVTDIGICRSVHSEHPKHEQKCGAKQCSTQQNADR